MQSNQDSVESLQMSNSKKRLNIEFGEMITNVSNHYTAFPSGDNWFKWFATFEGPVRSVYEGGIFFIEINLDPQCYPYKPPNVTFKTRIYHCNVNSVGYCKLSVLSNWNSTFTIKKVLQNIYELLSNCDPENSCVEYIKTQYLQNRDEHDRIAKLWTKHYAV